MGLAACSIAVFSFHYHATLTWIGEYLDGVSLYLLAGFPIAWSLTGGRRGRWFPAIYLAVAAFPAALAAVVPESRKLAFLAVSTLAILTELVRRRGAEERLDGRWLALSVGSFGLALVAWSLDWTRAVCDPYGPWQLHAVWHALSAPTIIGMFMYYEQERGAVTDDAACVAHAH
ncbi:MAG: ceramidase [Myxococcota bacterium]|nr:ceramidase [Myxococcota bacterium]